MAALILAAVEDLFFLSKIEQTARQISVSVEFVPPAELEERLSRSQAVAILLDLNCRAKPAIEILRGLKAQASTRSIPVLGFVSHVQGELIAAARAAGCDAILARSAFSAQLPQLLEKLADQRSAPGALEANG